MARRDSYADPAWAKTSAERAQRIVGRNIQHLRENRGWNRPQASAEAAERGLVFSAAVWERIEGATRGVTLGEMAAFAEFFGIGVGDLLAVSPPCATCGRMGTPASPGPLPEVPEELLPEPIHEFTLVLNRAPTRREASALNRVAADGEGGVCGGETEFWTIHAGGATLDDAANDVIGKIRTVRGFDAALDPNVPRRAAFARRWFYGWEVQVDGKEIIHIDRFDVRAFVAVRDRVLTASDGKWIDGEQSFMSMRPVGLDGA